MLSAHRNSGELECMVPLHFGGQFRPSYQLHTGGMDGNTGEFRHVRKNGLVVCRSQIKTDLPLIRDGGSYPLYTTLHFSARLAGIGRLCEGTRGPVGLHNNARYNSHEEQTHLLYFLYKACIVRMIRTYVRTTYVQAPSAVVRVYAFVFCTAGQQMYSKMRKNARISGQPRGSRKYT